MRNTADVTGGKPIAVLLQSISGVSAINHLVAVYDIHGGKREALLFYFVPDTTRDYILLMINIYLYITYFFCKYIYITLIHRKYPDAIDFLTKF
jgi:hypothetical protein